MFQTVENFRTFHFQNMVDTYIISQILISGYRSKFHFSKWVCLENIQISTTIVNLRRLS